MRKFEVVKHIEEGRRDRDVRIAAIYLRSDWVDARRIKKNNAGFGNWIGPERRRGTWSCFDVFVLPSFRCVCYVVGDTHVVTDEAGSGSRKERWWVGQGWLEGCKQTGGRSTVAKSGNESISLPPGYFFLFGLRSLCLSYIPVVGLVDGKSSLHFQVLEDRNKGKERYLSQKDLRGCHRRYQAMYMAPGKGFRDQTNLDCFEQRRYF